jgi:hypothetical protein
MNKIYSWLHGARWRMSLAHCAEALPIQLASSQLLQYAAGIPPTQAWIASVVCVATWFWSREKCQHEQRVKEPGASNTSVTFAGIFPFEWDRDSQFDLYFPVASSAALAGVVHYFFVRTL